MSKKKLNADLIKNELSGQSVFFKRDDSPISPKNVHPIINKTTENRSEIRPEIRTENRSEKRPVCLPIKRRTKRNSFEFYEDQLDEIKKIKIETELDGASISQSEIVREAIDFYFKTVRKSERSENRTE